MTDRRVYTDEEIGRLAGEISFDLQTACLGKPSAAVFLAIGTLIGHMEMMSRDPRQTIRAFPDHQRGN